MTRVDFHTHVGDKLDYACRLAKKAYTAGEPLVVLAAPSVLREFDTRLWTFSALEFIPHCMLDGALAAQTPVLLAEHFEEAPHYRVLLNLKPEVPPQFARFERLLEIIGEEADDLVAGRERYRFYRDRGYPMNSYRQG
jgi:DNA polymerase-3 subunit chi